MTYKKFITSILIIFVLISKSSFAKENKILIKVNNEIITTIDVLTEIKYLSILNKEFEKIEKNKQILIAKNSLIRDKIKTIELLKYKQNLEINQFDFEKIIKNYFYNEELKDFEDYELFFKNYNLDVDYIRKKIAVDTFWKGFIYQKFQKSVKINELEINNNLLKKEKQNEYMLSEIVFTLDGKEKLNQKLKNIEEMIKGKSFAETALNFSISESAKNGGKLGWIKENILNNKLINELKKIDTGEYTKPIVIPGGFLILKKENVREIKNKIDKDKEIKIIIEKQTNDQLERFSIIYLNKLKKNIQINEL